MSTEIQKSFFPLNLWSEAVVSADSKSAVADCGLLLLIYGRQLRKAPLGKFKCVILQGYVDRYVSLHTHNFRVEQYSHSLSKQVTFYALQNLEECSEMLCV